MRRILGAAGLAAALVLVVRAGRADPAEAVIDFENATAGPITEAFSADWLHGPFAIDGMTAVGTGQAIVAPDPSGSGQYLTLDHVTGCGCAMLRVDLHGASGELADVESFRIVGTKKPAHVVFLDAGGNSWPTEAGQEVAATGDTGSSVVTPAAGAHADKVAELLVFFEGCGGLDDLKLLRDPDHDPPPPPEPPAPPPPPPCELNSITLTFNGWCGDVTITDPDGNTLFDIGNCPGGWNCVVGDPGSPKHLPDWVHCVYSHEGQVKEEFDVVCNPTPDVGTDYGDGEFTLTGETKCASPDDSKHAKKHKKPKKPHKKHK